MLQVYLVVVVNSAWFEILVSLYACVLSTCFFAFLTFSGLFCGFVGSEREKFKLVGEGQTTCICRTDRLVVPPQSVLSCFTTEGNATSTSPQYSSSDCECV